MFKIFVVAFAELKVRNVAAIVEIDFNMLSLITLANIPPRY